MTKNIAVDPTVINDSVADDPASGAAPGPAANLDLAGGASGGEAPVLGQLGPVDGRPADYVQLMAALLPHGASAGDPLNAAGNARGYGTTPGASSDGTGAAAAGPGPSAADGGGTTPSGGPGAGVIAEPRDNSAFLSTADDQNVSSVLKGFGWNTTNITFSFPDSSADYGTSQGTGAGQYNDPAPFNGFSQLSTQQFLEVLRALGLFASYTNLTFTQITETSTTHATLRWANSSSPPTSYAYTPSPGDQRGGDSFFGTSARNPIMGNYASAAALLHETGHMMGFAHPDGGSNGVTGPYGLMNANVRDIEFSLMNYADYFGQPSTEGFAAGTGPQTYMMYDIAALQYMYGANFGNAGQNITYTWSATTGEEFVNGVSQGVPADNHIFATIWTGGANSTYDLSNFSDNGHIDMNPGGWMMFSTAQLADLNLNAPAKPKGEIFAQGDIYNALQYNGDARSLIDNVITGSGNDTIIGNAANNVITAGNGNNTINGEGGRNTLTAGTGADKYVFDAAVLSGGFDDLTDYGLAKGDQLDLSALLAAAYNLGSGQSVASLVRMIEDPGGSFADLQIDPDGAAAAPDWTAIGQLDGFHLGNAADVILDPSLPAGVNIKAAGLQLSFTGVLGNDWNNVLVNQNGSVIETNWTGNVIPGANDDLTIGNSNNVVITGNDHNGQVDRAASLTIASGSSLTTTNTDSQLVLGFGTAATNIALANNGVVSIGNDTVLGINASILNSGVIALHAGNPQGNLGSVLGIDSAISLTGGGSIALTDPNFSRIEGGGLPGVTLDNVDNTIFGSGQIDTLIGGGGLTLKNEAGGTIDANVSGGVLALSTSNTITNDGILEANSGRLVVSDAVSGSGHVVITGGGSAEFQGAVGNGATVSLTAGTLQIDHLATNPGGVQTQQFNASIAGLVAGDQILFEIGGLGNFNFIDGATPGAFNAGSNTTPLALTTVSGTVATLTLDGNYAGQVFSVSQTADGFSKVVLGPPDVTPPVLVNDTGLTVAAGATVTIAASMLRFDDNVSSHAQETYTVLSAPADGTLLLNGVAATGFTQADIDNGLLSYHETVIGASPDSFAFRVADAAGNATGIDQFIFTIAQPDNTPPTLVNDTGATVPAGTTVAITAGMLRYDDNVSSHAQESYTIVAPPVNGQLLLNGAPTTGFTQANIDNGAVSYQETSPSATTDDIVFQVSDAAGNTTQPTDFHITVGAPQPASYSTALQLGGSGQVDFLTFSGANLTGSNLMSTGLWNVVANGDYNGDGQADLVTQGPTSQIDLVYLNGNMAVVGSALNGTPFWAAHGAGNFGTVAGVTGPAIITQSTAGQIDLLWLNSGGVLAGSDLLNGSYWNVVGAGDFNGDGRNEIVTQSSSTGQIDLLSFTGANLTGSELLNGSYDPVVAVDDFDHNSIADLTTQNPATGFVDHLIFTGVNLTGSLAAATAFPGIPVVDATSFLNHA